MTAIIISCEHAVNTIPTAYQHLFHQEPDVMNSHYAFDIGAIDIAKHISQALQCPLIEATASRLLIDCNRSLHNAHCFSSVTKRLPQHEKKNIIDHYYSPFRQAVDMFIHEHVSKGIPVIHLSIHSFTPILNNIIRNTDIGLLYDPSRFLEKKWAIQWRNQLLAENPTYRVRMNYPYRGTSDGFVTTLRKQYPERYYLGFEIENNSALTQDAPTRNTLSQGLSSSLRPLCQQQGKTTSMRASS